MSKKNVLVVDDDEGIRVLLTEILRSLGHEPHSARNGKTAMEWLSKHRPDLIIMDLMMPDVSGSDLCRWVRSRPDLKGVPILQISALRDEATQELSLMTGADDFIPKPFDLNTVRERMERAFRRRGAQAE